MRGARLEQRALGQRVGDVARQRELLDALRQLLGGRGLQLGPALAGGRLPRLGGRQLDRALLGPVQRLGGRGRLAVVDVAVAGALGLFVAPTIIDAIVTATLTDAVVTAVATGEPVQLLLPAVEAALTAPL